MQFVPSRRVDAVICALSGHIEKDRGLQAEGSRTPTILDPVLE